LKNEIRPKIKNLRKYSLQNSGNFGKFVLNSDHGSTPFSREAPGASLSPPFHTVGGFSVETRVMFCYSLL
jgi:hypothetical protein